jgi:hypothetical protein
MTHVFYNQLNIPLDNGKTEQNSCKLDLSFPSWTVV